MLLTCMASSALFFWLPLALWARTACMFVCADTKIGRCKSLGDQVRVLALRLGGSWSQAREDLANQAEQWFGRKPVTTKQQWRLFAQKSSEPNNHLLPPRGMEHHHGSSRTDTG